MRLRWMFWIVALQLIAGLGVTAPQADAKHAPGLLRAVCRRVQEPTATGLRLLAEQADLPRRAPGIAWPLLLGCLTVPLNIMVWAALARTILGDAAMDGEPVIPSPAPRRRPEAPLSAEEGPAPGWSFPTSLSDMRR